MSNYINYPELANRRAKFETSKWDCIRVYVSLFPRVAFRPRAFSNLRPLVKPARTKTAFLRSERAIFHGDSSRPGRIYFLVRFERDETDTDVTKCPPSSTGRMNGRDVVVATGESERQPR